jgi:ketosteroid isomerase-like protein
MKKAIGFFVFAGLSAVLAFGKSQKGPRTEDEQALRKIESETAEFEQRNDASKMSALADDWVCLVEGGRKALSNAQFQQNVKHNFVANDKGPSPYTIEKKNMRVDLFGDTAVVTYIKEYRQTEDPSKFFDEDDTDVFTRSFKGWRLRLTKVAPAPPQPASH